MSALDWMLKAYPEVKEREDMRRIIGRYGLTGAQQVIWCISQEQHCWKIMKPLQSLPLQIAERLRRVQPGSIAIHVIARAISD